MGCARLSPIWVLPLILLLGLGATGSAAAAGGGFAVFVVALVVFGAITRKRFVVVTDRSVYLFSKKYGAVRVKEIMFKARLGELTADCGFTWSLRIGDSPRTYATLDSGLGERKRVAALINDATAAR